MLIYVENLSGIVYNLCTFKAAEASEVTFMYKKYTSFKELTDDFVSRSGPAIIYCGNDGVKHEISYAELADMINAEAAHIRAMCGFAEVVRADHSVETVVSILAHVIVGADVIITDPMVPDDIAANAAAAAEEAKMERSTRRDSRGRISLKRKEGELLFFTSGTTSRSKIVRLTSGSLCASAWNGQSMLSCGEGDVILSILPLAHVYGFVCSLLWGLAYGAAVALGRGSGRLADDAMLFRPTIVPAVPSQISAMIEADAINPELRTLLIGAAPCTPATITVLREKGIDVYLGYGLTETASGIAITQDPDEPLALYPCPDSDIRVEPDGEVTIATPCMMEGYIGAIPMFDGDRFFTGDIGFMDEKGRLHLTGRKKDVLLMEDGSKIFCPEYEDELAEETGFADLGIVSKGGRAVLVCGLGGDRDVLMTAVKKNNRGLQSSQQIYDVIAVDHVLPRTRTGKLRRYELQEEIGE